MTRHFLHGFFFTALVVAFLCLMATPFAHADSCALRTHTQAEWGGASRGDNAASYRTKHFASTFPDGVVIGVDGVATARFTASSKVQLFLPATGAPGALTGFLVDPVNTTGGELAAEALAMTLNVGFDRDNVSFALADVPLANATITAGACDGMTVGALLSQAHRALGGLSTVLTPAQLSGCLALVNGNASVLSCTAVVMPAAENMTTPGVPLPLNMTQDASENTTSSTLDPVPPSTFALRVAPWYPKMKGDGVHYVLFCDARDAKPARYDWRFGDGEKLLGIRNGDVYHIFKRAGTYTVTCGAANATTYASMTVAVV